MVTSSPSSDLPAGLGLTSAILGAVGVLLFFLPVLGIPLGAVGLAFGVLTALRGGWASLRWPVVGIVVCGLAPGIGVVIALAPGGYLQKATPARTWQNVPDPPYAPPPARPGAWSRNSLRQSPLP